MLGCLADGTNESSTKRLMFQVLFFSWFLAEFFSKILSIYLFIFKKNTKIKVNSFECPKSIKCLKKIILGTSDAWSTIRLSNRPSDPAWIYLRLTDFKSQNSYKADAWLSYHWLRPWCNYKTLFHSCTWNMIQLSC